MRVDERFPKPAGAFNGQRGRGRKPLMLQQRRDADK